MPQNIAMSSILGLWALAKNSLVSRIPGHKEKYLLACNYSIYQPPKLTFLISRDRKGLCLKWDFLHLVRLVAAVNGI